MIILVLPVFTLLTHKLWTIEEKSNNLMYDFEYINQYIVFKNTERICKINTFLMLVACIRTRFVLKNVNLKAKARRPYCHSMLKVVINM